MTDQPIEPAVAINPVGINEFGDDGVPSMVDPNTGEIIPFDPSKVDPIPATDAAEGEIPASDAAEGETTRPAAVGIGPLGINQYGDDGNPSTVDPNTGEVIPYDPTKVATDPATTSG